MVSETHLRLLQERIDAGAVNNATSRIWINVDMQKQLALENINVWEINSGETRKYRISIPGLRQDNYNNRVMIRGKQTEQHILGQYTKENVIINMYNITEYMTEELQVAYLQLLHNNNIRECIEQLRELEKSLNSEVVEQRRKPVKIHKRIVKKGK